MDSKEKIKLPCYIGETRTKAGVFLSTKIAKRRPYGCYLRLKKYADFSEAVEAFVKNYKEVIGAEKIKLNYLYDVREEDLYSVFSTPFYVGIVKSSCAYQEAKRLLPTNNELLWWKHNLTYKDAQWIASERFVKYWKNPQLYVPLPIRIYSMITLDEVKKQNGIS